MMASFKKPWTLNYCLIRCCKFIIIALSQQLNMKTIKYGKKYRFIFAISSVEQSIRSRVIEYKVNERDFLST